MKIRTGFVSNSSSASFVVAIRKTHPCPSCGRGDVDLLDIVEHIGRGADYEDTELKARGAQLIRERWKKDKWCDEQDQYKELYALMEEAERKGYTVGEIEVSYHDTATNDLLKDMEKRNSLIVLWSDHRDINNVQL